MVKLSKNFQLQKVNLVGENVYTFRQEVAQKTPGVSTAQVEGVAKDTDDDLVVDYFEFGGWPVSAEEFQEKTGLNPQEHVDAFHEELENEVRLLAHKVVDGDFYDVSVEHWFGVVPSDLLYCDDESIYFPTRSALGPAEACAVAIDGNDDGLVDKLDFKTSSGVALFITSSTYLGLNNKDNDPYVLGLLQTYQDVKEAEESEE